MIGGASPIDKIIRRVYPVRPKRKAVVASG